MSRVLIAQRAHDDIAQISDYIATSNPTAAIRFINRVFDQFELYATHVTFFRPLNDGIRVVHVFHGARQIGTGDSR